MSAGVYPDTKGWHAELFIPESLISALYGCEFSVKEGEIRGNLRSKCSLDVSQIAARHDGGGHAAAAGFTFYGTVEEALDALLPELIELVHTLDA